MSQAQKHRGGQTHGLLGMASELRLPWPEKVVLGGDHNQRGGWKTAELILPRQYEGLTLYSGSLT